jgi:hypothetical protein
VSWFSRIEQACAAFIERAFANMFPSDVEPAQIARKLVATMEARTRNTGNAMVVPSQYTVFVHPGDFSRLGSHRAYLEHEWSALLADVAARVGAAFSGGPPAVTLAPETAVVPGGIEIAVAGAPRPRRRQFFLRVVKGAPSGAVFPVSGAMRVGREAQCDIPIPDPSVSRSHALLDVRDNRLVVRDSGSTNGTFVNGRRVESETLKPGDVVGFGKTQMLVASEPP